MKTTPIEQSVGVSFLEQLRNAVRFDSFNLLNLLMIEDIQIRASPMHLLRITQLQNLSRTKWDNVIYKLGVTITGTSHRIELP